MQVHHVTVRTADKGESWDDEISTISTEDDAIKNYRTPSHQPPSAPKVLAQNHEESFVTAKANVVVPRTIEAFVETEEEASGRFFLELL